MPRISVLMPCRDASACLPDAIASLDTQSFTDFEVLAVDDGSTDGTGDLLAEWADRDHRVRVLTQGPRGIVTSLRAAAEAARGEIIARMDADDVAHPRRLERQLGLMDGPDGVDACGCGVRYFPSSQVQDGAARYEQWINSLVSHDDIVRDIFVECPIPHPTLMVRRGVLEAAGGYQDNGWPEDYDLVFRLWLNGARFGKVPAVLLQWREHAGRASRTDPRYGADAFRRARVHYLRRSILRGRAVTVWGAGPVGKSFARTLGHAGVTVAAFIDVDAAKVGNTVHDVPVVAPDSLADLRHTFIVCAVGNACARDEIRQFLGQHGWQDGTDYVAVA